jgi:hypothetical protein
LQSATSTPFAPCSHLRAHAHALLWLRSPLLDNIVGTPPRRTVASEHNTLRNSLQTRIWRYLRMNSRRRAVTNGPLGGSYEATCREGSWYLDSDLEVTVVRTNATRVPRRLRRLGHNRLAAPRPAGLRRTRLAPIRLRSLNCDASRRVNWSTYPHSGASVGRTPGYHRSVSRARRFASGSSRRSDIDGTRTDLQPSRFERASVPANGPHWSAKPSG